MSGSSPNESFARLFAQHERRIYSYIFSLLGDWTAADDVFQDTCVVLWSKYAEFQPGTDFASWACQIAHYKVLKHREQCRRRLPFVSDEFIETVAAARASEPTDGEDWLARLSECMEKLSPRDRELILRRYAEECTIQALAAELGIPANTAYKAISRIRKDLLDCVQKTAAREEHA